MKLVHHSEDSAKVLDLSMSEDRLKCFVRVQPKDEHKSISEQILLAEIAGICPADLIDTGVLRDVVRDLQRGVGCDERRIAKGIPPIHGRNGKIVWLVRRHTGAVNTEDGGYLPDLFHLGLFENVRKGQPIARIYPPTNGKDGRDVLGAIIPCHPGRPVSAKVDKSVKVVPAAGKERFDLVISEIDGYAKEEQGKISVKSVLEISGDVDYRIGHIDFIGGVTVFGDVNKGFNIRAKGPIEVRGSVAGNNALASDSSITVRGFHAGGQHGSVIALGDYTVSVAEGVRAEVRGAVIIEREARDCVIRCSTVIIAPKGAIVGGSVWSVGGIEAREIGNQAGLTTQLELHNALEVTNEYQSLRDAIQLHYKARNALELHLGPYAKDRRRLSLLQSEFRNKISSLVQKYDQITASLAKLEAQAKTLHESSGVLPDARINVHEKLFPGAVFVSNEIELVIKTEIAGPVSFALLEGHTEWAPIEFKPFERSDEI